MRPDKSKFIINHAAGLLSFLQDLSLTLTGFVGLKNGGATCYMNAVLQQLYMIPQIRANLLSLPCIEENIEDDMSPAKLHHLGVATQVCGLMFCFFILGHISLNGPVPCTFFNGL